MPTLLNSLLLIGIFIFQPIGNKSSVNPNLQDWPEDLNTTKDAFYLNQYEKDVILEINKVRNNPAKYAEEYIKPLRLAFDGKKFSYPGQTPMITREGVAALSDCIQALEKASPLPPLVPSRPLSNAAKLLVTDQKLYGGTGHITKSGWDPQVRARRYGSYKTHLAENIVYGYQNPRQAVISLLVDDGVADRAHRKNILNPIFKEVGIASATHPKYNYCCTIEFVDEFIKK